VSGPATVRRRLEGGEGLVGTFVQGHDQAATELLAGLGLDLVCVEAEHSAMGPETVRGLVAAAALGGAPALVRVAGNDATAIAAALDAGAQGVVVPRVDSAAEAAAAVAATRYPPLGARGLGPGRAAGYGADVPGYLARADTDLLLAVQVETRAAVDDIDALLEVDGVDMLFVGPGDLACSLGIADPRDPGLAATIESILRRAADAGRLTGIFAADPEAAKRRRAAGADLVILGSDFTWLAAGTTAALAALRGPGP
jgi:4-hydroxy-2-oxoheptanedioate aldolase